MYIAIDNINWKLLREQKQWLLQQEGEHAEGLINLLDYIQDEAVENGVPEEVVFVPYK